jgi:hypothetical protein
MNKLKINSASSWFLSTHISRCTVNNTKLCREMFRFLLLVGTDIRESSRVDVRILSFSHIRHMRFLFRTVDLMEH